MYKMFLLPSGRLRLKNVLSRSASKSASGGPSFPFAAPSPYSVFSDKIKTIHRDRAAQNAEKSRSTDYLREIIATNIAERVLFVNRNFNTLLELGSGPGYVKTALDSTLLKNKTLSPPYKNIILADTSKGLLERDKSHLKECDTLERKHLDSYSRLPFPDNSVDAVVSCLTMQWVNDLPAMFREIERILVPDGCFIAALTGNDTLFELRTSIQLAELERLGGVSPRVSPMTGIINFTAKKLPCWRNKIC